MQDCQAPSIQTLFSPMYARRNEIVACASKVCTLSRRSDRKKWHRSRAKRPRPARSASAFSSDALRTFANNLGETLENSGTPPGQHASGHRGQREKKDGNLLERHPSTISKPSRQPLAKKWRASLLRNNSGQRGQRVQGERRHRSRSIRFERSQTVQANRPKKVAFLSSETPAASEASEGRSKKDAHRASDAIRYERRQRKNRD